jgi:hypothetical protein
VGAVPRTAVGIKRGIGRLRQRAVDQLALWQGRRAVDRRAHQRMAEAHPGAQLDQSGALGRRSSVHADAEVRRSTSQ